MRRYAVIPKSINIKVPDSIKQALPPSQLPFPLEQFLPIHNTFINFGHHFHSQFLTLEKQWDI